MKKYLLSFALLLFLITQTKAQFIIAGQHSASDHYVDIDPDTSIYSNDCYVNYSVSSYMIDMNGDSIIDFKLDYSCDIENTSSEYHCEISPYNNNQIAFAYVDTCIYATEMAYPFGLNDSINNLAIWKDTTLQVSDAVLVSYFGSWICRDNSFQSGEGYIGVRVFLSSDTLFGWIKVSFDTTYANPNYMKIESYACNLGITGIKELQNSSSIKLSPNPATNQLTIHLSSLAKEEGVNLFITNVLGQTVSTPLFWRGAGGEAIDVSSLPTGLYLAKVVTDKSTWTGKFIKQ